MLIAVLPFLALLLPNQGLASASLGWVEAGPERGHVLDLVVCPNSILASTRVGSLGADAEASLWTREPRIPTGTRRLACDSNGTIWAAPPGQLWRIGEKAEKIPDFPARSTAVDLATTSSGVLIAAIRGNSPGVLRIAGASVETLLPGRDPFCVAASGKAILVGTTDAGAWLSTDDGLNFRQILTSGSVSAVAFTGANEPWIALSDGRVLKGETPAQALSLAKGPVVGIAEVDGGVLLVVDRREGTGDALYLWNGSEIEEIAAGRDDNRSMDFTGAWSLPDGSALIGTFRGGPFRYAAKKLRPARAGFRATVTAGAAVSTDGRFLLSLMGTGSYLAGNASLSWLPQTGGAAPVTDAVEVVPDDDGVLVVDMDGLTRLDAQGTWTRQKAPASTDPGRRGGLDDVAWGTAGWWGLDTEQRLLLLENDTWTTCSTKGGLWLDGQGDSLLLATPQGLLRPGTCTKTWEPLDDGPSNPHGVRVAGDWLALPGSIAFRGNSVATLSNRGAAALAVRGKEALVADLDGRVLLCGPSGCEEAASATFEEAEAVGWLPDGRIWLAERAGTLLVADGSKPAPRWSIVPPSAGSDIQLARLERPSWNDEDRPRATGSQAKAKVEPPKRSSPEPICTTCLPWTTLLGVTLLTMGVGLLGAWFIHRKRDDP